MGIRSLEGPAPGATGLNRMDTRTAQFYARHAEVIAAGGEAARSAVSAHFSSAFPTPCRVLDVGTGSGRDLAELARRGHEVWGLEPSPVLRELARRRHPDLADRVLDGALPDLSGVAHIGFDAVTCSAVLMHIPPEGLPGAIQALCQVLRPGGRLLLTWPEMEATRLDGERDRDGRLFTNHPEARVQALLAAQGARCLSISHNDSVLASTGTLWITALFER